MWKQPYCQPRRPYLSFSPDMTHWSSAILYLPSVLSKFKCGIITSVWLGILTSRIPSWLEPFLLTQWYSDVWCLFNFRSVTWLFSPFLSSLFKYSGIFRNGLLEGVNVSVFYQEKIEGCPLSTSIWNELLKNIVCLHFLYSRFKKK